MGPAHQVIKLKPVPPIPHHGLGVVVVRVQDRLPVILKRQLIDALDTYPPALPVYLLSVQPLYNVQQQNQIAVTQPLHVVHRFSYQLRLRVITVKKLHGCNL